MADQDWYIIKDIDKLDTPVLVVYPERVQQNIVTAKEMIGDVSRLRPHVKTYKNREVTQMLLDAGITKFKCATIAEAEMLGMCKAPDVLLAYQPSGPKLGRFIELILKYPDTNFSCLVDNLVSVLAISDAAVAHPQRPQIDIYLDINVGMNRTGIAGLDEAVELYSECYKLPGINVIGLHAYDGHIRDVDIKARTLHCEQSYELVKAICVRMEEQGHQPVIIAGGSPTFPIHAMRKHVEASPGTFVYWDRGYRSTCPEQDFLPAALVVSRVVSLPTETTICLDLGHKSIAPENELGKRVYFLNAPELKFMGHSEEHLIADAGAGHHYKIGDVLYGLPYHICPTVALYERAITIENNKITGEWLNIARDRKITI